MGAYTLLVTPLAVPEPSGEDFPNTTFSRGWVRVGESVTGNIASGDDAGAFTMELKAETRYQFDLGGSDTSRGTLADPRIAGMNGPGRQQSPEPRRG